MADNSLPPAPVRDPWGSYTWEEWFRRLRDRATASLTSVSWTGIDFTSSSLTSILDRKHNDLQTIQGGTSAEYYHLTSAQHSNLTGTNTTFTNLSTTGNTTLGDGLGDVTKVSGNLVVPKTSGYGIQVDTASPSFGWKDLLGNVIPKTSGVGSPTLSTFRGGQVRSYSFKAGDDYDGQFHLPHDYLPGSDMYIHFHWGHNGTSISGSLVVNWYLTYAKGHNQAIFPAEVNNTQTITITSITSHPRYQHFIEEVQITTAGGSSTQLNTNDLEPDGVIMFHFDCTTIPTITGGSPNEPFIFYIDLHYQATNVTTKNKAPNFYT